MAASRKTIIEFTTADVKCLRTVDGRPVRRARAVRSSRPLAQDIREALGKPVRKGEEVVFLLSRREVVFKQVSLPSSDDHEIRQMASLQITEVLPYPAEEIVWDVYPVRLHDDGSSDNLIVAARRDQVEPYLNAGQEAGCPPDTISVSTFGITAWLNSAVSRYPDLDLSAEHMVLCPDREDGELLILRRNDLVFSAFLFSGTASGEGKGPAIGQAAMDTFRLFQKNGLARTSRVLILPGPGGEEQKADFWAEEVPADTVVLTLDKNDRNARDEETVYYAVLGAAVRGLPVQLIPSGARELRRRRESRKKAAALSLAAAVFIVSAAVLIIAGLFKARSYRDRLAVRQQTLEQTLERYSRHKEQVRVFQKREAERMIVPQVIHQVYRLLPEEIYLKALSINSRRQLTLDGTARDTGAVNALQKALVASSAFEGVRLHYAKQRKRFADIYIDFKITGEIAVKGGGR
ncbi:MAG: PilN domain-containing protein [Candidatus Omnitrophota bacterium]